MKFKDTFQTLLHSNRYDYVDVVSIAFIIWYNRKFIFKWELIGLILSVMICYCTPKEYVTNVSFSVEKQTNIDKKLLNKSLSSIFESLVSNISDKDAYTKNLYALLVNSPDFLYDLLDVYIPLQEGDRIVKQQLRDILDNEKSFWGLPKRNNVISKNLLLNDKPIEQEYGTKFQPTKKDIQLIDVLQHKIFLSLIEKTGKFELEVIMQNSLASAALADTVLSRLNKIITEYRESKSYQRLKYAEINKLEAQIEYNKALENYACLLDSMTLFNTEFNRTDLDFSKSEVNIKYRNYLNSYILLNLERYNYAKNKPVYHILNPSAIQSEAAYPRIEVIFGYCAFLFFYFPTAIIIIKFLRRK